MPLVTTVTMEKRIILDTNFLLIPGQFNVDIFAEMTRVCNFKCEFMVVPETVLELEGIVRSQNASASDKRAAKLAIQLIEKYVVKVTPNRKVFKRADEAILAVADKNTIVATQDRDLREKLKANKTSLIILRQKKYLMLLGD